MLDDLSQMWLTCKVVPLEASSLLLSILFPVRLVLKFGHADCSELLNFIVVDNEDLSFKSLIGKLNLSISTCFRVLEADKGMRVSTGTFFKSDIFNFSLSTVRENSSEILFSPVIWEILDVKIKSLFRSLISDGIHELLLCSLSLVQGLSNVKFETITHISVEKSFKCLVDTVWSIKLVFGFNGIWLVIADKTKLSEFVLEKNKGLNVTEWGKDVSDIFFLHFSWDVLEVHVVNQFTHNGSVVLLLKLENLWVSFDCFHGTLLVFKANVCKTFLRMIRVG